jgi:hypothetical protein
MPIFTLIYLLNVASRMSELPDSSTFMICLFGTTLLDSLLWIFLAIFMSEIKEDYSI